MQKTTLAKILIVDDEVELVNMAKRKLERAGYEVSVAYNGEEALKLTKKEAFDLIVTDVIMPVMDGFTLFKNLKDQSSTADIPVIILTARSNMEDSFKALGVDGFLPKPFDGDRLLSKIEAVIARNDDPTRSICVLITSAQKEIAIQMRQSLLEQEAQAQVVEDGLDLIKKAYRTIPDVILLDVLMPGLKSPEVIKALRSFARLKNCKIIVFTQYAPDELGDMASIENLKATKNECMIAGADKYIGRYTPTSFLDSLREYDL